MKQSINLNSVVNARELGGYVNVDGKKIKKGLLFRTGKLKNISKEDMDTLVNIYNLKKVYDFRGKGERTNEPDPEMDGVINHWIPILDENNNNENNAAMRDFGQDYFKIFMFFFKSGFMKNLYVDMLKSEFGQAQYHKFLKDVIETESGAILWHCSAGKDRTGCAALFLLTILNCSEELILEDYVLTNEFTKEIIENRKKEFKEKGCPEEYMDDVLCIDGVYVEYFIKGIQFVKDNYGSVMDYIHNQLKITEEECEILRKRYLE